MRAWVKLLTYQRMKPVNGIAVFNVLQDERNEPAFLHESVSRPHVKQMLSRRKEEGYASQFKIQCLPEKGHEEDDCEFLEFCVLFRWKDGVHIDICIDLLAGGQEDCHAVLHINQVRRSTWGPVKVVCDLLDGIYRMLAADGSLAAIYEMLERALDTEFRTYSINRHVCLN